jgi:hypothetical protein
MTPFEACATKSINTEDAEVTEENRLLFVTSLCPSVLKVLPCLLNDLVGGERGASVPV